MSSRYSYYLSLVLVLLVGLVISLIPISSASGSPQSAVVQLQPPAASLTSNSLVRYSHTLLLGSNGTPTQNGTALLSVMNTISNSNPSATKPYLLKLEPGQYDLGSQSLSLLPYVDLEGSGEDTTVISSTISNSNPGGATPPITGTLVMASNSEIRFLTVENTSPGSALIDTSQVAIYVPSNATHVHITHITAVSTNLNIGMYDRTYGLHNSSPVTITVQNSTFSASGGNLGNYSIQNNALISASQLNSMATGLGVICVGSYSYDSFTGFYAPLSNACVP
ncbi:MAG: hypothetical protein WCS37_22560 [Chloroflexota bacterium]|nr:hypothetical protein [Chloroflexota bacterium]